VRRALPVGHDFSPDSPKVLHRPVVVLLEFLTYVTGPVVVADIHTQKLQKLFLILASPVCHAPLLDLGYHPVVDGNAIRFLEVDCFTGPLAGRHFFILRPEFIDSISPILVDFILIHVLPPFQ